MPTLSSTCQVFYTVKNERRFLANCRLMRKTDVLNDREIRLLPSEEILVQLNANTLIVIAEHPVNAFLNNTFPCTVQDVLIWPSSISSIRLVSNVRNLVRLIYS